MENGNRASCSKSLNWILSSDRDDVDGAWILMTRDKRLDGEKSNHDGEMQGMILKLGALPSQLESHHDDGSNGSTSGKVPISYNF